VHTAEKYIYSTGKRSSVLLTTWYYH